MDPKNWVSATGVRDLPKLEDIGSSLVVFLFALALTTASTVFSGLLVCLFHQSQFRSPCKVTGCFCIEKDPIFMGRQRRNDKIFGAVI